METRSPLEGFGGVLFFVHRRLKGADHMRQAVQEGI